MSSIPNKTSIGLWLVGCSLITFLVSATIKNPDWSDETALIVDLILMVIIFASYPSFFALKRHLAKVAPKNTLAGLIGWYLIITFLANLILPTLGITHLPFFTWLPLPSFEIWFLSVACTPPVIVVCVGAYIVISGLTKTFKTKTSL